MDEKTFFSIFQNNGDRAAETTARVFAEDGSHKDVTADYRISGIGDDAPSGSGMRAKSKAGNAVIRISMKIGKVYWNGTLNFSPEGLRAIKAGKPQPEHERSGLFGTLATKDKQEKRASGWVRLTKNGQIYLSCSMEDPYDGGAAAEPAMAGEEDDPLPF